MISMMSVWALAVSTHSMVLYSSSTKSAIRLALSIHGFQTTVELLPCLSILIVRSSPVSLILQASLCSV